MESLDSGVRTRPGNQTERSAPACHPAQIPAQSRGLGFPTAPSSHFPNNRPHPRVWDPAVGNGLHFWGWGWGEGVGQRGEGVEGWGAAELRCVYVKLSCRRLQCFRVGTFGAPQRLDVGVKASRFLPKVSLCTLNRLQNSENLWGHTGQQLQVYTTDSSFIMENISASSEEPLSLRQQRSISIRVSW